MRRIVLSDHARDQLGERRLAEDLVVDAIREPDELLSQGERVVAHKMIVVGGRPYLLRVFYEQSGDEVTVVTVYRTSKIEKYRSAQ